MTSSGWILSPMALLLLLSALSTPSRAQGWTEVGLDFRSLAIEAAGQKVSLVDTGESCSRVPRLDCGRDGFSWCNMPHVAPQTYRVPPDRYVLEYVEVIQRHHKRTPYSSNIFPQEDGEWGCDDAGVLSGLSVPEGQGKAVIQRRTVFNDANPFNVLDTTGFKRSSCQFPQLTREGYDDSATHGSDLRKVYGKRLGLSYSYDPSQATFRVTNNALTSQVASGFFKGFYPSTNPQFISVDIQPSTIDSLEPTYSCPRASALRNYFTTGPNGTVWRRHLEEARGSGLWQTLDDISGIPPQDNGWHVSFDHYFDNLAAKECHARPLPCHVEDRTRCITPELADKVYETGHWEYSYLYRDAPGAHEYSILKFGAWMLELKDRLEKKAQGTNKIKYAHNVAHDGSLSSLLGYLQIEKMQWPGMGSEVVFELYRDTAKREWSVRVLWSGQPMVTSSPLATLDMVPLDAFLKYVETTTGTGRELYDRCFSALG